MRKNKKQNFQNIAHTVMVRYELGEHLLDICTDIGCNYGTAANYLSKHGAVKGKNAELIIAVKTLEAIKATATRQKEQLSRLRKIHDNLIKELLDHPVTQGMKQETGIKARADAVKVAIENAQKLYDLTLTKEEELKRKSDYLKYMELVNASERAITEKDIALADIDHDA